MSTGEAVAIGFAAASAAVLMVTLFLITRVYTLVRRVEVEPRQQHEQVEATHREHEPDQV